MEIAVFPFCWIVGIFVTVTFSGGSGKRTRDAKYSRPVSILSFLLIRPELYPVLEAEKDLNL